MDNQANQNKSNTELTMTTDKSNVLHISPLQSTSELSSPSTSSSRKRRSILYAISRLKQMKMAQQEMHLESNISSDNIDSTPSLTNAQSDNTSDNNTVQLNNNNNPTQLSTIINSDSIQQSIPTDFSSDALSLSQLQQPSPQRNPSQSYNSLPDDHINVSNSSSTTIQLKISPKESSSHIKIKSLPNYTTRHDNSLNCVVARNNSSRIFIQCLSDSESDEYIDLDDTKMTTPINDVTNHSIHMNHYNHTITEQIPTQLSNHESIQKNDIQSNELVVICSYCPRVFHAICLCATDFPDIWLCPECQDVMLAECSLYQLESWCKITKDQLKRMLFFLLDRLSRQSWAWYFREPVDSTIVKHYKELIKYPIDLHTLYSRVKSGEYASLQAFLGDFRWILHNCIIFNGASSSITSSARLLDRTFHREFNLMRACPICYLNRMPAIHLLPSTTRKLPPLTENEPESYLNVASVQSSNESNEIIESDNISVVNGVNNECNSSNTHTNTTSNNSESKSSSSSSSSSISTLDPWWFCKLCDVIHPIVWIRLQNYPRWPAKVIAHDGNFLLVSFFGDYDVTIAPIGSAKLHSSNQSKSLSKLSIITMDINTTTNNNSSDKENRSDYDGTKSMTSMDNNDISNDPSVVTSQLSSKRTSSLLTSSMDPIVQENFHKAITELNYHVNLIYQRYPNFKLPVNQLRFTKRHVKKYYGPFTETPSSSLSETTNLTKETNSVIDMTRTVNATQVTCNTTSSSINTTTTTNASVTNSEKMDNSVKLNRIPSSNDAYREPVLTRVAASLRNSPVISSESSSVLQTSCPPVISVNTMKRKHNDTSLSASSSPAVTLELESVSSEDIRATVDHSKKKRKKSKHHNLKKITFKPLSEDETTTIITSSASNDETDSNNNNNSSDTTVVIKDNALTIETGPTVTITTSEMQPFSDIIIPSTSNTSDNVHMVLDDFRNSINEALQKLQEKLAPTINATDNAVVYPTTTSELPNLHPIYCDIAIQTNDDLPILDHVHSLKPLNVMNESKSIQTDGMELSTNLSISNDDRPSTLQERMMEAEILHMEQEIQRLNILVRYTRAEMGLEMQRRISELRRIWNDELIAIMEAASRIWEYDVVRIVDVVKRRQWFIKLLIDLYK
ncbi:putative bromodomain containing protein [Schistosoma mansoni]|uniref:putative bromodomain containing protein n=1 Tax=Schistosoma mansoni TaxID=6183 RepID=UPI0001A62C35|nr:putative bromodomain containing protein [Schistosoma mansoni]|eukprot:XP_018649607.1 putative bromodomain containing protein [Schistosoma mansoni]